MKDKKLVRVMDQVNLSREREDAILANLLREEKEVANMKNTRKRRLPAASLAAAVLVVVLAGTAVAGGYFGRLDVSPVGGDYEKGYNVQGAYENIPSECLSEELLEHAAQAPIHNKERVFGSWSEAEEFIGVEIANNPILGEMAQSDEDWGRCTVDMDYDSSRELPGVIWLYADYLVDCGEGPFGVNVFASMRVKADGEKDLPVSFSHRNIENVSEEKYVTPSGIEVTIFTQDGTLIDGVDDTTFQQSYYTAYFSLNNALFTVHTLFNEQTADSTLSMLKQVLDAYE